jgi:uncharacterized repeat protein (TIGR02543 family)
MNKPLNRGLSLLTLFITLLAACSIALGPEEEPGTEPSAYTVTFKTNDGTETNHAVKTVTPPATTIAPADFPADPARTGYSFTGWNTKADGSGSIFAAPTTVTEDVTVYAQWTAGAPPGSYAVTFKKNDGTETNHAVKTVIPPATTIASADFPGDPTRTGYSFTGWNTKTDGSGSVFAASATVTGDVTVYAQWSGKTYTVTFKKNDGTGNDHASKTVTVPATTIASGDFPANPARTGYTFTGWNLNADGSGTAFTASATVNGDITAYAQWLELQPGSYAVTFKRNDGTETNHGVRTVTPPATTIAPADFPGDPARTGYAFTGWNTKADGTGSSFTVSAAVRGDVTVYAGWTVIQYTVTFNGAGGTPASQTKRVNSGASIGSSAMPATPARSGYVFDGWHTAQDGTGSAFTASTPVTGDVTVYAGWTVIQYTVTFNGADGSPASQTKRVNSGASIGADMPAEPARNGYAFGGWHTGQNGTGSAFTASTPVTGDMTVHAKWTGKTYTVTFKANGGTPSSDIVRTVTFPATSIASNFPANPSRTGYDFTGWNTRTDGAGSGFAASTPVTGDVTIYAQWLARHTVTFDADGGSPAAQTKTVTSGASLGADMLAEPDKTGYGFDGWYTAQNEGGEEFTGSTAVTGDITVYAKWLVRHTVTFDADGGTPAEQTLGVNNDASAGATMPAEPEKAGHGFVGWYTGLNGSGEEFTSSTAVTGDITVYAKWLVRHTVTFDADGGDPSQQTLGVNSGASAGATMPAEPEKAGHGFVGWYTGLNGSGTEFTSSTTVTGDITVYAKWLVRHTVTFDADGGTPAEQTLGVNNGASAGANMPVPGRNGYDFGGWHTGQNGGGTEFTGSTAVTGDIRVYAKWTPKTYTVTFKANGGSPGQDIARAITVPVTNIDSGDFPADPTRTGYDFSGWNTQANGSGSAFTTSTTVSGDVTVYAQWTGKTWTVTFKANGGSPSQDIAKTVTFPATNIAPVDFPATPSRTGYDFVGWNTAQDGSGSAFTASTTVTGNTTVYATWTGKTWTVTFKANGGTPSQDITRTVTVPANIVAAGNFPADPSRTGYLFAGWNTQANGSGSAFTASTPVTDDTTVYAKWTTPGTATITLDPDAGSGAFSQADFALSKSGGTRSRTVSITGSGYADPRWFVDGELKGTEDSIAINAADYGAGGHTLALIINKGGVSWSRELKFTVNP